MLRSFILERFVCANMVSQQNHRSMLVQICSIPFSMTRGRGKFTDSRALYKKKIFTTIHIYYLRFSSIASSFLIKSGRFWCHCIFSKLLQQHFAQECFCKKECQEVFISESEDVTVFLRLQENCSYHVVATETTPACTALELVLLSRWSNYSEPVGNDSCAYIFVLVHHTKIYESQN